MGEKLFAQYLKDVKGQVSVGLNGKKIDEIAFTDIGSVSGFYGSKYPIQRSINLQDSQILAKYLRTT